MTASQPGPPAAAPLPPPTITSTSPASPAPGTAVTLTGQNFGASQGSSYLTLAQGGTSWERPYDGAKLTITNWSEDSITFELPPDGPPYPLVPGQATITVTVANQHISAPDAGHRRDGDARADDHRGVALEHAAGDAWSRHRAELRETSRGRATWTLRKAARAGGRRRRRDADHHRAGARTGDIKLPPDSGSSRSPPGTATVTATVSGQARTPRR